MPSQAILTVTRKKGYNISCVQGNKKPCTSCVTTEARSILIEILDFSFKITFFANWMLAKNIIQNIINKNLPTVVISKISIMCKSYSNLVIFFSMN